MRKRKAIGIDLGTTYSVVASIDGTQPIIIPNLEGFRTTPSMVGYVSNNRVLVGQIAKRQRVVNSKNTFTSVKRFIGSKMSDLDSKTLDMPYKIVADENSNILLYSPLKDSQFRPEILSSLILRKIVEDASIQMGKMATKAVITVPAYFTAAQREATWNAGEISGLEMLRIINEPTAAALAYGLDKKKHEKIVIFDLGGGTFDISILEVGEGLFEVLAAAGDAHLGGDDFDRVLLDFVIDNYYSKSKIDIRSNSTALQRVSDAVEEAKIALSSIPKALISVPFIIPSDPGSAPYHLSVEITRQQFEDLAASLIGRCYGPTAKILDEFNLGIGHISKVVLVGGSTRIPAIESLVADVTNIEPTKSINPDEVVALGAAIQAGVVAKELKEMILLDITPLSLGIELLGGEFSIIVERNTTIPTERVASFTTAKDKQTTVEIKVFQGEREVAQGNKCLGVFALTDIPPQRRAIPKIDVIFDLDISGILSVTARDAKTLKEQSIVIKDTSKLTKTELNEMLENAKTFKEADKATLKKSEDRLYLEELCYIAEFSIKYGDLYYMDEESRINAVRNTIEQIRQNLDSKELESDKITFLVNKLKRLVPNLPDRKVS